MLSKFKQKLDELDVPYKSEGEIVSIQLPGGFGELEYKELPEGDDILGLVDDPWHTHSSVEGGEFGLASLVKNIFLGKIFLIKEVSLSNETRRTIQDNLEDYLRWLPQATKYEIINQV